MSTTITRPDGASLTLDAAEAIILTPSVTVTEHPIEDGADIADHAQVRPLEVSIRGIITESPLGGNDGGPERVERALTFLRECEGLPLTVEGGRIGVISNLVLTGFPQRFTTVRNVPIDLTLRQVRIAETGSVQIPPRLPRPSAQTGAPDEQDAGNQPTDEDSDEAAKARDRSTLRAFASWLGGGNG